MATIRPMRPDDLLKFSSTNLDHLTETYNIGFYLEYLTKWPELCQVIEGVDGEIEGYSTFRLSLSPSHQNHDADKRQSSANSNPPRTPHPSTRTRRPKPWPSNPTTSPGTATSPRSPFPPRRAAWATRQR